MGNWVNEIGTFGDIADISRLAGILCFVIVEPAPKILSENVITAAFTKGSSTTADMAGRLNGSWRSLSSGSRMKPPKKLMSSSIESMMQPRGKNWDVICCKKMWISSSLAQFREGYIRTFLVNLEENHAGFGSLDSEGERWLWTCQSEAASVPQDIGTHGLVDRETRRTRRGSTRDMETVNAFEFRWRIGHKSTDFLCFWSCCTNPTYPATIQQSRPPPSATADSPKREGPNLGNSCHEHVTVDGVDGLVGCVAMSSENGGQVTWMTWSGGTLSIACWDYPHGQIGSYPWVVLTHKSYMSAMLSNNTLTYIAYCSILRVSLTRGLV